MPKDGLRRLPDHVTAALLRALMTIPRRPDSRLILQRPEYGRPPGYDRENDFRVLFRGRAIGRIWRYDYAVSASGDRARYHWHWHWRDVEGREDTTGDAPTLQSAMADFRRAWDGPQQREGEGAG
jgi:hypothetical protein